MPFERTAVLLAAVAAQTCTRILPEPVRPTESSTAAVATEGGAVDVAANDAQTALSPIPSQPLFTNLVVPGFPEAVVALPNGANTPRPVLVVLHGSGDRPDWNCDAWRHITGDYGFVLCPRGDYVPNESNGDDMRYTLRGGSYLQRHIDAALAALGARFAGYVDIDRPALAGFSLGAAEVASLAISAPSRFARVAELEASHDAWTPAAIRSFASGGQRVLFACGSSWCLPSAESAVERLAHGGIEARVVHARVGHTTDRPLQEAIMAELAWFLKGDPRWKVAP